jgi:hypothetical protein
LQTSGGRLAEAHVATRLLLQERQVGDLPDHDHPQPLRVVVQGQDDPVHGEADAEAVLRDELSHLPSRHARV